MVLLQKQRLPILQDQLTLDLEQGLIPSMQDIKQLPVDRIQLLLQLPSSQNCQH